MAVLSWYFGFLPAGQQIPQTRGGVMLGPGWWGWGRDWCCTVVGELDQISGVTLGALHDGSAKDLETSSDCLRAKF